MVQLFAESVDTAFQISKLVFMIRAVLQLNEEEHFMDTRLDTGTLLFV